MIAVAKVHANDAAPNHPIAITVTTPAGVQYVGGKRKSQMAIIMLTHGFSLN